MPLFQDCPLIIPLTGTKGAIWNMTMVHERTRSVVQTEAFLRDIVRDVTLPEKMRLRAEGASAPLPRAQ